MNVQIIRLPVSRWPEYKALRLKALKTEPEAYTQRYEDKVIESDNHWINKLLNDYLYFLELDTQLIGMAQAFQKTAECWMIFGVFLDSQHRGKGLGKKLLENVIAEIKKLNGKRIIIGVNTNQKVAYKLYKSLGFVEKTADLKHEFNFHDVKNQEELLELLVS